MLLLEPVWAFIFVMGPMLQANVEPLRQMGAFIERTGIEAGEFYYTDVSVVSHAQHSARSTIEYMPRGPRPIAQAHP